ncbi:MAG: alpha/beta fold hydrolase [Acidobacteria bacterium]|nr:MAG: alpha/beta fold hydrolase [Acidobacteriota bacterium]
MAEVPQLPPFIARQLPFERRLLTLDSGPDAGRTVHLIDHGPRDARAVLLLHGNPTWSFLWRKVIAELGELRCVAPDLLGLGLSSRLPAVADHTVERHADAVAEVVERLDLRRLVLVGQDWGGPIATAAAARRLGRRVAAVVLGNTAVVLPDRPRGTAFHRFARLPLISDVVFRLLGFPQILLHRTQGDPSSIRGDVARAYRWPLRRLRDRIAPLALARMVPDGPDHPSIPALRAGAAWIRAFRGPLHLVWGERDPILGRALRRHQRALPQARIERTQAGHFLQEEVPEVLARAIREAAGAGG